MGLCGLSARDIAWGRTENFLLDQLYASINLFPLPLRVAGEKMQYLGGACYFCPHCQT